MGGLKAARTRRIRCADIVAQLRKASMPSLFTDPGVKGQIVVRGNVNLPSIRRPQAMTQIVPGVVDVYVIQPDVPAWQVLLLERAAGTRCPLTWETVHGHIEEGELPEQAAIREVREETGLSVDRLYNVTVQPFYLHSVNTVELAVVFAAFVKAPATVVLGPEHRAFAWASVEAARSRFVWPRCRTALDEIVALLSRGHAGPVEDVLRVF